jgi:transposase-like protein
MKALDYRGYFARPAEGTQRRYEALRAVFIEEEAMQTVACRFGVRYGTVRNWVSEFRRSCDAGQAPPFLLRCVDAPQPAKTITKNSQSKQPMCERCHWKPDADW